MIDEKTIPLRLRTIADALIMGEKVAWKPASEILHAAADEIERRRREDEARTVGRRGWFAWMRGKW